MRTFTSTYIALLDAVGDAEHAGFFFASPRVNPNNQLPAGHRHGQQRFEDLVVGVRLSLRKDDAVGRPWRAEIGLVFGATVLDRLRPILRVAPSAAQSRVARMGCPASFSC